MANAMIFGHLLEDLNDGVTVFREGVGKPMPLSSTDIDIEITAGLAVVVTTRKFSNSEDVPIEAILTMPVGFNAVVTGLSAMIDGRRLRAVAKAKDAARDHYEAAIDEGKMAVLHEEVLRGIHGLSLGQLAPGKEVQVELRMVVPLANSGNGPFLRLPMTAGQLYGSSPLLPADDLVTDAHVRHEATLTIRTEDGVPVLAGRGPVKKDGAIKVALDRAVEIIVEGGRFGSATGLSADGYQVRIDMRPQQASERNLKLAVLVDRSGSTSSSVGSGTETVLSAMRSGLAQALADIHEDDHIALWQFSDDCQRLGTGRGTEVLQILKKLNQPGGGTRLGAAIRKVAASGIQDILVLTDGQTWETLPELAAELDIRVSAVLVGKASLDANIGHLCALTGGELFYVPEAEVGPSVRLALQSKQTSRPVHDIELMDGRPSCAKRSFGGIDVIATWGDAMEVTFGTDVGRFAAWLCLGKMGAEEAQALALREGLCTQATSLVLVDEAGEVSKGLSETRKVPLMQASTYASIMPMARMAYSEAPPVRFMRRDTTPGSEAPSQAFSITRERIRQIEAKALAKLHAGQTRKLRSFLDKEDQDAIATSAFNMQKLEAIAVGIDWETQANRFLSGDFAQLLPEEASILVDLEGHAAIARLLAGAPLAPRLVLLAWLARCFVTHSRAAQRFAQKVFGQFGGRDVSQEILNQIRN